MNFQSITQQVVELSLECGAFMKKERETFSWSKVEFKGKNNLVSYVDKETEKMIVSKLKKVLPQAGFITEEGTVKTGEESYKWIIDPLDGTTNYIHGVPCYSTSIALVKDTELLLGVVFDVVRDNCYYAYKGGGSFCNGMPIQVSENSNLENALIATGFPYYNFDRMENYLNILKDLMKECHGLRRWGSAAIDLIFTATGYFEGFFEYNLNPWDVAAGIIIVQEAGGTVTDFSGGDNYLFGREIVAANGVHPEFLAVVKKHW
ncbi:MAG: inositol monophosphatase [Reichenbachiella sp.]